MQKRLRNHKESARLEKLKTIPIEPRCGAGIGVEAGGGRSSYKGPISASVSLEANAKQAETIRKCSIMRREGTKKLV